MPQTLTATYQNGSLVLEEALALPEGTKVEVFIQSPQVVAPSIATSEEKRQLLRSLVERMQQNPIPENSPQLNRDMLHERHLHKHTHL